ncbi:hypothetical protein R6Y99_10125 [Pseudomonas lundensis]|uniref:hypothetical protein n=1 Tax=Serratia proteamaculans TaxID=28151 RepID=UPI002981FBB6|nr:hypothetical protein [Serratia proteamaculans]MDW5500144.1 hypothetical protein [Serratia proteamaculans]MDW5505210.1 hypothetical protein [Pseudomonas lundensis]
MILIYFEILILVIFFASFLVFLKKTNLSYWAPLSTSTFFDAIFFVGERNMAAMIARIVLLLLIPTLIFLRMGIDLKSAYLFTLMVGSWSFLMYCYCYRGDIRPGKIKSSAIFSEVFFAKRVGVRSLVLWGVRLVYIAGIFLHFSR